MARPPWNAQLLFEAVPATAVAPASSRPCSKHPGNVHVKVSMSMYTEVYGSIWYTVWSKFRSQTSGKMDRWKSWEESEKRKKKEDPAIKNCTSLWREAHFEAKGKTSHVLSTFGSWDVENVWFWCGTQLLRRCACSLYWSPVGEDEALPPSWLRCGMWVQTFSRKRWIYWDVAIEKMQLMEYIQ